ncbi:hypothetical protein, partial [Picosynechococcus sp. NKBG15041c]|uniref:hypothetical protein n=1 Tax=Picosynechococcus sp. NKBG15041c TaxID=1407650 RepID=UPI000427F507
MPKTTSKKLYKGMSYRKLQRWNKEHRSLLEKKYQIWLKQNSYQNIGWDRVIKLHEKILDLKRETEIHNMSLEELFLESDRIGEKYQTSQEKKDFQERFQHIIESISIVAEKIFPDDEVEFVDFGDLSK